MKLLLLLLRLGCCRCSPPLPAIVALGSVVAGGRRAFFLPCSIYPPPLKALTVLEYLVAHGSESVIDEIKEHAYQISFGRAYFELVDYLEADLAFSLARRPCPCSLDGMDIYSTVLYHLKEDMKLSYLVQELLSINRLAPQTWVRICMSSLSKEGSKAFCCTYMYTWDRRMKN